MDQDHLCSCITKWSWGCMALRLCKKSKLILELLLAYLQGFLPYKLIKTPGNVMTTLCKNNLIFYYLKIRCCKYYACHVATTLIIVSSTFKYLKMHRLLTHVTPIFITETLHLVTYIQLS